MSRSPSPSRTPSPSRRSASRRSAKRPRQRQRRQQEGLKDLPRRKAPQRRRRAHPSLSRSPRTAVVRRMTDLPSRRTRCFRLKSASPRRARTLSESRRGTSAGSLLRRRRSVRRSLSVISESSPVLSECLSVVTSSANAANCPQVVRLGMLSVRLKIVFVLRLTSGESSTAVADIPGDCVYLGSLGDEPSVGIRGTEVGRVEMRLINVIYDA